MPLLLCLPEESKPAQKQHFCSSWRHQRGPQTLLNAIKTLSSGSDRPETFNLDSSSSRKVLVYRTETKSLFFSGDRMIKTPAADGARLAPLAA